MTDRELAVVYDLADEAELVEAMQAVSRRGEGLSVDPALVGSDDWWRMIRSGEIELHVVEGVVADSYWTGHGDYPMFDLRLEDASETSWARYGDETRYVVGLAVRLSYVEHGRSTHPMWDRSPDRFSTVVVRVELEPSDEREVGRGKHR